MTSPVLQVGDFIRVRKDHEDRTRADRDGQVAMVMDTERVGLIFGLDRAGKAQPVFHGGVEEWRVDELDLASIDR